MKRVCILGSTGSIGTQALEVCEKLGYPIVGLAVRSNIADLACQAERFRPEAVCVFDSTKRQELKSLLKHTNIRVLSGMDGLCELASMGGVDILLNAVVGMVGLEPTLAAIHARTPVALANKETLVTGGKLVMEAARRLGVPILPVDSEHSAIFQCLQSNAMRQLPVGHQVKKILLTASGGPFFGKTRTELAEVTVEQALRHPNWSMGAKVTIDSATLMNKGLELMEACWLFDQSPERIEIVVHRESILHSLVEFDDHAVLAQMGVPDMKLPIQYALTWPERLTCPTERLSLTDCRTLTFAEPDRETFECLSACEEAMHRGGLAPTIVNGANEEAVRLFLERKIRFLEIGRLVTASLSLAEGNTADFTVADIRKADAEARAFVRASITAI